MAGALSCVPCDCKWNQWMLNLRLYEAGQGGNSAPGKCGFCSHNKTDCWENFFFCCLYCGKSSQRLQFPNLSMACSDFAMPLFLSVQWEALSLYCWSTRVTTLQDPGSIITCYLYSPLQETGYRHKRITLQLITSYQFYISFSIQN